MRLMHKIGIITIIFGIFALISGINWIRADIEVKLYNKIFNKNHTTLEFFIADDVIKFYE